MRRWDLQEWRRDILRVMLVSQWSSEIQRTTTCFGQLMSNQLSRTYLTNNYKSSIQLCLNCLSSRRELISINHHTYVLCRRNEGWYFYALKELRNGHIWKVLYLRLFNGESGIKGIEELLDIEHIMWNSNLHIGGEFKLRVINGRLGAKLSQSQ